MNITFENYSFIRENWYKGIITYEGIEYPFWIIDSYENFPNEEPERITKINWFFTNVPKEVKKMNDEIIEQFKNQQI